MLNVYILRLEQGGQAMTIPFKDRRQFDRRMGDGLAVLIDGRVYPMANISVSGLCFQGTGFAPGTTIRASLANLHSLHDSVEAQMTIKVTEGGMVRAEFLPTTRLMRFIIAHLGDITGERPAYFR
jgi:hypothetical protein